MLNKLGTYFSMYLNGKGDCIIAFVMHMYCKYEEVVVPARNFVLRKTSAMSCALLERVNSEFQFKPCCKPYNYFQGVGTAVLDRTKPEWLLQERLKMIISLADMAICACEVKNLICCVASGHLKLWPRAAGYSRATNRCWPSMRATWTSSLSTLRRFFKT